MPAKEVLFPLPPSDQYLEVEVHMNSTRLPTALLVKIRDVASSIRIARTGIPFTRVSMRIDSQSIRIAVAMAVRDRDTLNPGNEVQQQEAFPIYVAERSHGELEHFLYSMIRDVMTKLMRHELDEMIHLRGRRAEDPHIRDDVFS